MRNAPTCAALVAALATSCGATQSVRPPAPVDRNAVDHDAPGPLAVAGAPVPTATPLLDEPRAPVGARSEPRSPAASPSTGAGATTVRPSHPDRLWGSTYRSVLVTRAGAPRALVPGTAVTVTFLRRPKALRWNAGCNTAGAGLDIRPHRLVLDQVSSSSVGCDRALTRQEGWVNRFFLANPRWRFAHSRLRLHARRTTIELVRDGTANG